MQHYLDFDEIQNFSQKYNDERITALMWNFIEIIQNSNQSSLLYEYALSTLSKSGIIKESDNLFINKDYVLELENKINIINWDLYSLIIEQSDEKFIETIPNEFLDKWNNLPEFYKKILISIYKSKYFDDNYKIKLFWETILN